MGHSIPLNSCSAQGRTQRKGKGWAPYFIFCVKDNDGV